MHIQLWRKGIRESKDVPGLQNISQFSQANDESGEENKEEKRYLSRRKFFFLAGAGLVGLAIKPEIIVPEEIKLFDMEVIINPNVPKYTIYTMHKTVADEYIKLVKNSKNLFERDNVFYNTVIKNGKLVD